MKSTRLVTLLVLAVLLIGAIFWRRHSRSGAATETAGTNAVPEVVASDETKPELPSRPVAKRVENDNAPAFAQASTQQNRKLAELGITPGMTKEQMQEKMAEQIRAQREKLVEKWKNPISFYGKAVDENTNPVAQAAVTFIWNDTSETGSSKSDTTSDQNGLFYLTGVTGRGLSVYVEKPGYYYVKRSNQTDFDYSEGFVGDPNKPIIFHLRKKGAGVDLVTSQYGVRPVLQFSSPHDGSPVRVDFFNRKVGADGQMEASQNKPAYGTWQTATGWSYRLAIPDGGFVETADEFPFEAPESGYQPVVEFKFQKGDANWTERLDKTFYIAFGNPRRYGRIHVETSMTTGTILEYAINPDGSRNLESK